MNFKQILTWGAVAISTLFVGGAIASSSIHPTQGLTVIDVSLTPHSVKISPTPTQSPSPDPISTPLSSPTPTPRFTPTPKNSPSPTPVSVKKLTPVTSPIISTAPEANSCDPNYSGACVPIASDVDCAGGSGNGPAYVRGPVAVIGTDKYDLDRDGDGIGCDK